jgi:mono/diheme cytochrome c family protein
MTGMPAWRRSLTNEEMWSIVAYLDASDRIPQATFSRWRSSGVCKAPAP